MNANMRITLSLLILTVVLAGGALAARAQQPSPEAADADQGTAFTYQGRLNSSGSPANGSFDFQLKLFDDPAAGAQVGATQTQSSVAVSQGNFTLALDFGPVFDGQALWLEIGVRPAGSGAYTLLTPRQALSAAPYALGLAPGAVVQGSTARNTIEAVNTASGGVGLFGETTTGAGVGVYGLSNNTGVFGLSSGGNGVWGQTYSTAPNAAGVYGNATDSNSNNYGVFGRTTSSNGTGVRGLAAATTGLAIGVKGETNSPDGYGVLGVSVVGNGIGVAGDGSRYGVFGESLTTDGIGVRGVADGAQAAGVYGSSINNTGVLGLSTSGISIWGQTTGSAAAVVGQNGSSGGVGVSGSGGRWGVYGYSSANDGIGVRGFANGHQAVGVYGDGMNNTGVFGYSESATGVGVWGYNCCGYPAGYFSGSVHVNGTLSKAAGSFQIDHPLDPANQYLYHSFVESPDMTNLYTGTALLDANGEATVTMPDWFQALNGGDQYQGDYRYQLTPIGAPMPNLYIAQEIQDNVFKIGGGAPGMKVSWMVTGIRHDPYAEANRIPVEAPKPPSELGTYLFPQLYGQPASAGVKYTLQQSLIARSGQDTPALP
jgi:hypothetical protein